MMRTFKHFLEWLRHELPWGSSHQQYYGIPTPLLSAKQRSERHEYQSGCRYCREESRAC